MCKIFGVYGYNIRFCAKINKLMYSLLSSNKITQTTMAQNTEEVKIIREMFPKNRNYASILDDASLLTSRVSSNCLIIMIKRMNGPELTLINRQWIKISIMFLQTILAHCVHITDDEIQILKNRNVGISHCPNSNIRQKLTALYEQFIYTNHHR